MKAYNLAMFMIFFNCGFPLAVAMGGFGSIEKHTGVYNSLIWLANPIFSIGTVEITGVHAIMGITMAMIVATIIWPLGTRPVSSQGVAIGAFTGIFWVSFGTSSVIILSLAGEFPGLNIFYTIFVLAATLIFVIALIQLPTGGQKTHV